jgi:hypothetical protein
MSDDDDKLMELPTVGQLAALDDDAVVRRINAMIAEVETPKNNSRRGGADLMIIRALYLTQELARRQQDRQTKTMISLTNAVNRYTIGIVVMTVVIMVVTVWSAVHAR